MGWTFYSSSGEAMIIDGGVQNPAGANFDISSYKLVGNGGSTGIAISANGEVTMAAQPCVLVSNSAKDSNVTGNNTAATIDFNSEHFDQNADFASDTFTAPVTGKYAISVAVTIEGLTGAADSWNLIIVTSNRSYRLDAYHTNLAYSQVTLNRSIITDMDASDTATIQVQVNGEGSDVVDISGSGSVFNTFFSAALVA